MVVNLVPHAGSEILLESFEHTSLKGTILFEIDINYDPIGFSCQFTNQVNFLITYRRD